jgi:hypothetical protein
MNGHIGYMIVILLIIIIIGLREIAKQLKPSPTSYSVNLFGIDRFGSLCLIVRLQLINPPGKPHYHIASYLNLNGSNINKEIDVGVCNLNEFEAIFPHEPSIKEIREISQRIKGQENEG